MFGLIDSLLALELRQLFRLLFAQSAHLFELCSRLFALQL